MRIRRTLIIAAAGVLALAGTAVAQNALHNFQVKLGVSGVLPDTSATISTIGGGVDISDEYVPTFQVEYFLNANVSAELLCCVATHDVKAVGTA